MTLVSWQRGDESTGHSIARLAASETGWSAHGSEVLADGPERLACWFAVARDERWQTVAATPLTNTFPIRRLVDLPVGDASTSPVAWVEVPSLRVLRVEQTYRRLGEHRWEYSDPTHGAFVLDVDDEGLVVDYEGFARRVTMSATR